MSEDENEIKDIEKEYETILKDFASLKGPPCLEGAKASESEAKLQKKAPLPPSIFERNLDRFRYICKDYPSPSIFIDFDFYFMIAACLNRKVWLGGRGNTRLYPNQFCIAVAKPGVGKSMPAKACGAILRLLVETKYRKENGILTAIESPLLNLGPDTITFEKLVLRCHDSSETVKMPDEMIKKGYGKYYNHSSTTFCLADELTMLFTENTKRVVSFLQTAWDCDKFEGDTIKHGPVKIPNICVNLLGCAPLDVIRDLSRTGVFNGGMMARTIFLFGDKKRQNVARIITDQSQMNEQEWIIKHLRKLCKLPPMELVFTPEANDWLDTWVVKYSDNRINPHRTLEDYYARKPSHLQKLAIAVHFSEFLTETIGLESLIVAKKLLESAEPSMHRSFCSAGENAQYLVLEGIKEYLQEHGPTKKSKLMFEFYSRLEEEGILKVFDFMVHNDLCSVVEVDGKPGLKLK